MASSERVGILVDIGVKGRDQLKAATQDLNQLGNAGGTLSKATAGFQGMALAATGVGVALGAAAFAAKKVWNVIEEGAALNRTAARFDKLSASIGTTADVLTARLRAATHGTISDMELMASASQLISLRLADNADQVVRLGAVAGTLNWDMQQVILTMANMSTMRLDALGLSVSDVTSKARELELQGMSSSEAFKEAVIQAGEAQKALLDVGNDALRSAQQAEAAWTNAMDSMKMGASNLAYQTDFSQHISRISYRVSQHGLDQAEKDIKHAAEVVAEAQNVLAGGAFSTELNPGLAHQFRQIAGTEEGAAQLKHIKEQNDDLQEAVGILEFYRLGLGDTSEAAAILDDEIARINETIEEQARRLNATARPLADVFTEWVTDSKALTGETATNFIKNFSTAISGLSEAVDTAPLITLGTEIEGLGVRANGMTLSVDAANVALYQAAEAAGASAAELAVLGVATGLYTEQQADAALKTAILQEVITRLASDYANGAISVNEMSAALREQMNIIANMPSMFTAASQAANQLSTAMGQASNTSWFQSTPTPLPGSTPPLAPNTTGGSTQNTPPLQVNNSTSDLINGRSGGASYTVTVTNYIDGQVQPAQIGDTTVDKIQEAMQRIGVRR